MASRFWAASSSSESGSGSEDEFADSEDKWKESDSSSGSDSDSDSDSDSSSGSGEETKKRGPSKYLTGGADSDSDSDDEDEGIRVVKSGRDRRIEELANIRLELQTSQKAQDWSAIQTGFEKLNRAAERARRVLGDTARVYIRTLGELEDFMTKAVAESDKKKMNATQAKALNAMRQKIKKHNASYAAELERFRADPERFVDRLDADMDPEEIAERERSKARAIQDAAEVSKRDEILSKDPEEITFQMINDKLRDLKTARGKKGVSRADVWELLAFCTRNAMGPAQKVAGLLQMLSFLLDLNPSMSSHLPTAIWRKAFTYLSLALDILESNPNIRLDESAESFEERTAEPAASESVRLPGNLMAIVERLDDELYKALQQTDPHTNEYLDRLKDEAPLLSAASRASARLSSVGASEARARVDLRRIEHYYYKTAAVFEAMCRMADKPFTVELEQVDRVDETAGRGAGDGPGSITVSLSQASGGGSLPELITGLTASVYSGGDERCKARALLCCVYHKALFGDFHGARDLLLMSHLQDNIAHMDVETQILYNRALCQLGLAAFRKGLFDKSFQCLQDLYLTGRVRELLAQGQSQAKNYEKTPEQEALERRRLIPFHMHVNLELLESVHLTCCMLLEAPNLARGGRAALQARHFAKILDMYSRASFLGPPDTVRDHVAAATRALLQGDWQASLKNIKALPCWGLLQKGERERVEAQLEAETKRVALRTYLLGCGSTYQALELGSLAGMFGLPEETVKGVIGALIAGDELCGSLDSSSSTVLLNHYSKGALQEAARATMDKLAVVLDLNERAYTYRSGGLRTGDDEDGPVGGRFDDRFSGENRRGGRARGGRGMGGAMRTGYMQDREGGRGGRGGGRGRGGGQGERDGMGGMSRLGGLQGRNQRSDKPSY